MKGAIFSRLVQVDSETGVPPKERPNLFRLVGAFLKTRWMGSGSFRKIQRALFRTRSFLKEPPLLGRIYSMRTDENDSPLVKFAAPGCFFRRPKQRRTESITL